MTSHIFTCARTSIFYTTIFTLLSLSTATPLPSPALTPRQNPTASPSPSPSPTSSSSSDSHSSTATIAGIVIFLVVGTGLLYCLIRFTSCGTPKARIPTEEEARDVWLRWGRGRVLGWEEGALRSHEFTGIPNSLRPGQWVGGARGSPEEERALHAQYDRSGYRFTVSGGESGGGA